MVDGRVARSSVVASQVELHAQYGGIVPEVASRQHLLTIIPVVEQALSDANTELHELDAVAVTHGPGLAGSLLVGVNAAKGLAMAAELPFLVGRETMRPVRCLTRRRGCWDWGFPEAPPYKGSPRTATVRSPDSRGHT